MHLMISYQRESKAQVEALKSDLEAMGHTVWYDQHISGGAVWWESILENIRRADAVICALSPGYLQSYPCQLEYTYAADVLRPLLPVNISDALPQSAYGQLPYPLARLNVVEYAAASKAQYQTLARALGDIRPVALPDPLPTPPDAPISPLAEISTLLNLPSLTFEQQTSLVFRLGNLLKNPKTRADARALLLRLQAHDSLLNTVAREVETLLAQPSAAAASEGDEDDAVDMDDEQLARITAEYELRRQDEGRIFDENKYRKGTLTLYAGGIEFVTTDEVIMGIFLSFDRVTSIQLVRRFLFLTDIVVLVTRLAWTGHKTEEYRFDLAKSAGGYGDHQEWVDQSNQAMQTWKQASRE